MYKNNEERQCGDKHFSGVEARGELSPKVTTIGLYIIFLRQQQKKNCLENYKELDR